MDVLTRYGDGEKAEATPGTPGTLRTHGIVMTAITVGRPGIT